MTVAFKTPIDPVELHCMSMLASNARAHMAEAFKLAQSDNVLRVRAETAGKAVRAFLDSVAARSGEKA